MSCIHHLLPEEKSELYTRAADQLAPGGWLINVDEMLSNSEAHYRRSMENWWTHALEAEKQIPEALQGAYHHFMQHFENWRIRNLDRFGEPKQKGEDLHQSYREQLHVFEAAGLESVDLIFKYHLWHAIAGRKGERVSGRVGGGESRENGDLIFAR